MLRRALIAVAAATCVFAGVGVANAGTVDTFTQTSDHCSNPCGITTGNTVTVTDNGTGTLVISVNLASGWDFISSGAGGGASLGFAMTATSATYTQDTTTWSTSGWTPLPNGGSASATSPQTQNGTSQLHMDGLTFGDTNTPCTICAYGMTWNAGNGQAHEDGNSLTFDITGSLASLVTSGSAFAADVISPASGNPTGIIDFTLTGTRTTPLPATLPLFAGGLGLVGLLVRRKRKTQLAV